MISPRIPVLIACLLSLAACQTPTGRTSPSLVDGGFGRNSAVDGLRAGPLSQSLGEGLDKTTLNKALNAELTALETGLTGSATTWSNGKRASGKVIPGQVYQVGDSTCRRYKHQIVVDGNTRNGEGTACKGDNGMWTALN